MVSESLLLNAEMSKFLSYVMAGTSYIWFDNDEFCFVLEQHAYCC